MTLTQGFQENQGNSIDLLKKNSPVSCIDEAYKNSILLNEKYSKHTYPKAYKTCEGEYALDIREVKNDMIDIMNNLTNVKKTLADQDSAASDIAELISLGKLSEKHRLVWSREQWLKVRELSENYFIVISRMKYIDNDPNTFDPSVNIAEFGIMNSYLIMQVIIYNQGGDGGEVKPKKFKIITCGKDLCTVEDKGRTVYCGICICPKKDGKEQCAPDICPDRNPSECECTDCEPPKIGIIGSTEPES